jgi:hypothetical protein
MTKPEDWKEFCQQTLQKCLLQVRKERERLESTRKFLELADLPEKLQQDPQLREILERGLEGLKSQEKLIVHMLETPNFWDDWWVICWEDTAREWVGRMKSYMYNRGGASGELDLEREKSTERD